MKPRTLELLPVGTNVGGRRGAVVGVPAPGRVVGVPARGRVVAGGPAPAGWVVAPGAVLGAGAAEMLLVNLTVHVTTAPPPLPEPLHWWTDTGSAAVRVEVGTVHCTRRVPPPPLPELLHCVTVALVVEPIGEHNLVGWVPPPVPEPMHWFIEAGVVEAAPVILFTITTLQVTVPPPPLPEPSHCVTVVVNDPDDDGVVIQVGVVFAAPWHSTMVSEELVAPLARSRLLVTVTVHAASWPPTLSVPLHWFTELAADAGATGDQLSSRQKALMNTPPNTARRERDDVGSRRPERLGAGVD